jgi:tRNA pseudouridine38-40 synthase
VQKPVNDWLFYLYVLACVDVMTLNVPPIQPSPVASPAEVLPTYEPSGEVTDLRQWPDGMQRLVLSIAYQGSDFQGFQRQASARRTVQGVLEAAVSRVANHPVTLVCAGRTDAGVNATGQVVHFDTPAIRPDSAWREGVNTGLPHTVRVCRVSYAPPTFHARFSARARTYRYVLQSGPLRSPHLLTSAAWTPHRLNLDAMRVAAQHLVGEHDFSSFRARLCQAAHPVRRVHSIRFAESGPFILMEIKANAFLYNMVRNIMGSLIEVGRGQKPAD